MSATDRLNEIEARANAATEGPWFVSDDAVWVDRGEGNADGITGPLAPWCFGEADFIAHARADVPWLIEQVRKRDNALRAVLDLIDSRGKQAAEALPPSLAALAVPSYQFNVRASDVIRAIGEAFS